MLNIPNLRLVPMTNKKAILGISFAAVFAITMIASPIGADAAGHFLDIKKADLRTDSSETEKVAFSAKGQIPTDGTGGAFGYGYVSSGSSLSAVAVTTTHGGIKDSIAQENAADPVFHNHYVALTDANPLCSELAVVDITFEEPGDVDVWKKKAIMEDVPYYFAGTHSLTTDPITFNANDDIVLAVSFTIGPVDSSGNPTLDPAKILAGGAVCINDVTPVDQLKVKEVNKFF